MVGGLSGWRPAWKVVCLASTQKAERPSALVCLHARSTGSQLSHSARSIFAFRGANLGSFQAGGGAFTASEILWDMVRSCLDDGQGHITCMPCWKAGKKKADPACLQQDLTGFEIIKTTLSLSLSFCLSLPQNGDTDDAPEPLCPIYRRAVRENDVRQIHPEPDRRASAVLLGDDRATEVLSVDPEKDDKAVQQLMRTSRRVEEEGEEATVHQLARDIIPAMKTLPDKRLASNDGQLWCNSVPIPLDPNVRTNPLPLPKPKPDLAFGYSEAAFTRIHLMTLDLLVDAQFGESYAIPDQKVRCPFLQIGFKSQAKNGIHYITTNQAAGAGAIALNGNPELIRRSFGVENFDYEEP